MTAGTAGLRSRPWWPWARRGLTLAFFALVAWLLVQGAREIAWAEVGRALRERPLSSLVPAAAVAALSYLVYSTYDLLGRHYAGHTLPTRRVLALTFVSYAFNLNLGSLVGGIGFRHRLYSRLGLKDGQISRIIAFSMLTNWSGYLLLAGAAFLLGRIEIPEDWALGADTLRVVGALLVALAVAYLLLCTFSPRREWAVRGHTIDLPSGRVAGLQLLVSSLNWSLIALVCFLLLQRAVPYGTVLAVLLIAAVAGLLTHVPGGLGVIEAVFVALLGNQVPPNDLLAGLLAYRGVYYLAPLVVALVVYFSIEGRISRGGDAIQGEPQR
jgi:uncharacterized membrane protein YbhN (UPF0104 family)